MAFNLLWVPLGLFAALMTAIMLLTVEKKELPPVQFLMWLRSFSFLLLCPFMFFMPWPHDPVFYIVTSIAILLIGVMDMMVFTSAGRSGAGVTTRILPLSAFTTFFMWTAISPALLQDYFAQPLRTAGILLSIIAAAYFAVKLKDCPISRAAMKQLVPAVILSSLVTVLGKMAMDHSGASGPYVWAFLQSCFLPLFYFAVMRGFPQKFEKRHLCRPILAAIFCAALASIGHIVTKNAAFGMSDNPAYVLILLMTTPLWIMGYYSLTGHQEHADSKAGCGIVFAALALVIFTRI